MGPVHHNHAAAARRGEEPPFGAGAQARCITCGGHGGRGQQAEAGGPVLLDSVHRGSGGGQAGGGGQVRRHRQVQQIHRHQRHLRPR